MCASKNRKGRNNHTRQTWQAFLGGFSFTDGMFNVAVKVKVLPAWYNRNPIKLNDNIFVSLLLTDWSARQSRKVLALDSGSHRNAKVNIESYYINFSSSSSVNVNSLNDFQIPDTVATFNVAPCSSTKQKIFFVAKHRQKSREGEKQTNFSGSICIIAIFRSRVRDGGGGEGRAWKTGAGKKCMSTI